MRISIPKVAAISVENRGTVNPMDAKPAGTHKPMGTIDIVTAVKITKRNSNGF